MAHKSSAPAATTKRKASSTDKHSDDYRAKKAKTATGPKHQKFDDDEGSDASGFSDSDSGDAEMKDAKPSRAPGQSDENGRTAGKPVERRTFTCPWTYA